MKIGVLALQGDFAEHITILKRLKVETSEVRLPEHLKGLDGLIIPGGESSSANVMPFGAHVRARSFFRKISVVISPCSDLWISRWNATRLGAK
jgi:5'-phosphate synthase pdxT subunit